MSKNGVDYENKRDSFFLSSMTFSFSDLHFERKEERSVVNVNCKQIQAIQVIFR